MHQWCESFERIYQIMYDGKFIWIKKKIFVVIIFDTVPITINIISQSIISQVIHWDFYNKYTNHTRFYSHSSVNNTVHITWRARIHKYIHARYTWDVQADTVWTGPVTGNRPSGETFAETTLPYALLNTRTYVCI